jgi:uncharacterized protein YjeT (DUF2065 family)
MSSATTGAISPVDRFFEFALLGLLTSGYLAVVGSGYLDTPTMLLTAAAILFRGLLVGGAFQYQIPSKLVAAATLAYMAFYPLDYLYLSRSFLPATIHLVFFIAIVKILTANTNRDYFFLKVIAFMELLAACVLSASINFFLFLAFFLILGVATFMSSEIRRAGQKTAPAPVSSRSLGWRLSGVTGTISIGMLVLTGILFFLLPRTARAALQHILSHRYHLAGFSNQVSLGEIGEIKQQDTPVMHVKLGVTMERLSNLHWRGSALAQFDGRRWFNRNTKPEFFKTDSATGQVTLGPWRKATGLSYSVHLNDAAPDGTLFFAGTPQSMRIDAPLVIKTPVDSYRLMGGGYSNLSYQVFSYLDPSSSTPPGFVSDPPPDPLTDEQRDTYLSLPRTDIRIFELAHKVTEFQRTPEAKAVAIERHLRKSYGYTLEMPKVEADDPLAFFLFQRRKGHCEYFASAMAIMLRTVNIPSRIVTGFAGGLYNPISGWYVIRASDAHSWVEAWMPGLGWTTFDPTPPDPNPPQLSILTRVGFYMDAAEVFWQDWVLNYNFDRQLLLASKMEQRSRNFRMNWLDELTNSTAKAVQTGSSHGGVLVVAGVVVFFFYRFGADIQRWWFKRLRLRRVQRGDVHRSDATLLYERMLKSLKRRGIEKPPWLTPVEFARVVNDPELSVLVEDITSAYNQLRFGGQPDAARRIIRLLGRLEAI